MIGKVTHIEPQHTPESLSCEDHLISRLNEDLREEHGWSYGAHSRVSAPRGVGMITAGVPADKPVMTEL